MSSLRFGLLLLLAIAPAAHAASASTIPSAEADLAWLNRYLQQNVASRAPARPNNGPGIPFADLRQRIGAPLRVTLADGVSRVGVLVEANSQTAKLNVRVGAGAYLFGFGPEQVSHIEER